MDNENVNRQTANKKSSEKGISLGELFYVMKKNWIVELAIVLVITLAGVAYAKFFTKNYYVAKSDVIIKAVSFYHINTRLSTVLCYVLYYFFCYFFPVCLIIRSA